MKLNICFPLNSCNFSFVRDFAHPLCACDSWERIVCDCTSLYEKEIAALVALNIVCRAIRHFSSIRSLPADERLRISASLKLFCKFVKNFSYSEGGE